MGWFDDLANKVGFSSKSLGVNTAEDKAAREQADAQAAYEAQQAEYERANNEYEQMQAANQNDMRSAQGQYEATQKNPLDDLRGAQSGYEQSQAPSTWDNIRHAATGARQSVGNFISSNPNITAAAAGIGSSLIGYGLSKGDYDQARATTQDAAKMAGTYQDLGTAQTSLIQDSPEYQQMQMNSLRNMQDYANEGTTATDDAYRRQQENMVNKQYQARNAQIQDDMHRRGAQAGSGLTLAASLTNNQAANQQASEAADSDMIRKQNAKMAATSNLSNMANTAATSQFNRDLSRASAMDKFNLENVQNKMSASRAQANAMGAVANQQSQAGKNKADLLTNVGNTAVAGIMGGLKNKIKF